MSLIANSTRLFPLELHKNFICDLLNPEYKGFEKERVQTTASVIWIVFLVLSVVSFLVWNIVLCICHSLKQVEEKSKRFPFAETYNIIVGKLCCFVAKPKPECHHCNPSNEPPKKSKLPEYYTVSIASVVFSIFVGCFAASLIAFFSAKGVENQLQVPVSVNRKTLSTNEPLVTRSMPFFFVTVKNSCLVDGTANQTFACYRIPSKWCENEQSNDFVYVNIIRGSMNNTLGPFMQSSMKYVLPAQLLSEDVTLLVHSMVYVPSTDCFKVSPFVRNGTQEENDVLNPILPNIPNYRDAYNDDGRYLGDSLKSVGEPWFLCPTAQEEYIFYSSSMVYTFTATPGHKHTFHFTSDLQRSIVARDISYRAEKYYHLAINPNPKRIDTGRAERNDTAEIEMNMEFYGTRTFFKVQVYSWDVILFGGISTALSIRALAATFAAFYSSYICSCCHKLPQE